LQDIYEIVLFNQGNALFKTLPLPWLPLNIAGLNRWSFALFAWSNFHLIPKLKTIGTFAHV
jgi:hypothetical protein